MAQPNRPLRIRRKFVPACLLLAALLAQLSGLGTRPKGAQSTQLTVFTPAAVIPAKLGSVAIMRLLAG